MSFKKTNETWESLLTAHATLMREFNAETYWQGLNMSEYDVLYTLAKANCSLRLTELQARVLLSQPALSRLVDRLAARGLIARNHDSNDRRAVQISLTQEGALTQKDVGRAHAKSVAERLSVLTGDELDQLKTITSKLFAKNY